MTTILSQVEPRISPIAATDSPVRRPGRRASERTAHNSHRHRDNERKLRGPLHNGRDEIGCGFCRTFRQGGYDQDIDEIMSGQATLKNARLSRWSSTGK